MVENVEGDEHLESDSEDEAILVVEHRNTEEEVEEIQGADVAGESMVAEVQGTEDSMDSTVEYDEDASWGHESDAVELDQEQHAMDVISDTDAEAVESEEPGDPEIDVDSVDSNSELDDDAESSGSQSPVCRRPPRTVKPRKIFTYHKLGANPVIESIT